MADAYEDISNAYTAAGKAVRSLNCPECGSPLYATEKEKIYTWNCSAVMECDYRRTEPKKVIK